jgi:tRNA dimethylallyltransferase
MSTYKLPPTIYKPVVIVGPTSSGKSELAVKLAKKFKGEIISCDSRQIYRGMDLGTGKISGKWKNRKFLYRGIPHHCIDYVNPKRQYSVALFRRDAQKAISDILSRGKLPILCGGGGHWMDAVVYNQQVPDVKPNLKLRAQLEKKTTFELFERIVTKDPKRAKTIDRYNKRRLIRALEIINASGKPVPNVVQATGLPLQALWLGVNTNQPDLYKKIDQRLNQRLKQGMVKEVQKLHRDGLSWKKLMSFGLEYKFISLYLQKKLSYDEMLVQLSYAIKHYSKRQLTWWKRNKDILWIKNLQQAGNQVRKFLK